MKYICRKLFNIIILWGFSPCFQKEDERQTLLCDTTSQRREKNKSFAYSQSFLEKNNFQ